MDVHGLCLCLSSPKKARGWVFRPGPEHPPHFPILKVSLAAVFATPPFLMRLCTGDGPPNPNVQALTATDDGVQPAPGVPVSTCGQEKTEGQNLLLSTGGYGANPPHHAPTPKEPAKPAKLSHPPPLPLLSAGHRTSREPVPVTAPQTRRRHALHTVAAPAPAHWKNLPQRWARHLWNC